LENRDELWLLSSVGEIVQASPALAGNRGFCIRRGPAQTTGSSQSDLMERERLRHKRTRAQMQNPKTCPWEFKIDITGAIGRGFLLFRSGPVRARSRSSARLLDATYKIHNTVSGWQYFDGKSALDKVAPLDMSIAPLSPVGAMKNSARLSGESFFQRPVICKRI
jgi:hypothetical protein